MKTMQRSIYLYALNAGVHCLLSQFPTVVKVGFVSCVLLLLTCCD